MQLAEALEMRERLRWLVVIEVVVGESQMRLAVAEARISSERFLDQRPAARRIAEPEPRGAEVVGGPGYLRCPGSGGFQVGSARAACPASTSRRPRSAWAVAS
jgi:hypothetical protein